MEKDFVTADQVRNGALKVAARMYAEGFVPNVIYVPLRGGAYMGNVISEFFKMKTRAARSGREGGAVRPVYYAAVVVRSYTGIDEKSRVKVEGWTYSPDYLRAGDKVLLVDDVFDSGTTMNHLAAIILERGIPREDLRIAVYDYKVFAARSPLPVTPDYWCRRHDIPAGESAPWIHYLSHELEGLSPEERETYYYAQDGALRPALEGLYP